MGDGIFIQGGKVVTVDEQDAVLEADILVRGGRIERIIDRRLPRTGAAGSGPSEGESGGGREGDTDANDRPPPVYEVINARDCVVIPGFVQTHIHLCQTLMRGYADDLPLLEWLRQRVWPLEAAHTPESLFASARLGIGEMIRGGTTTALTMETVKYTETVFRAVEEMGFRAIVGKCMMDKGEDVPAALLENTASSIQESLDLIAAWRGRGGGRIDCAFAPRFALSCTGELLGAVAALARQEGVLIHTHASESRAEVDRVRRETGKENIDYLDSLGLLGPRTVLAHCVWPTDTEMRLIGEREAAVAHCPSSNLKLGSGIARITEMLEGHIKVSLGADGAPCNNRLDMMTEMRTAALLQKARRGPEALPAKTALRMATIGGARALGLESEVGSIEEGKRADLVLLRLDRLHLTPHPDLTSAIVYVADRGDVDTVLVDGKIVLRGGRLTVCDEDDLRLSAAQEAEELAGRAGLKSV